MSPLIIYTFQSIHPIKLQVSAMIKMFKYKTKLQLQKHMNLNYKLKYLKLEMK